MVFEDSKGDSAQGLSAFQKLISIDNVPVVIDCMSNVVMAIAPGAEKNMVINFAVSTASPNISSAGDFTFRHNSLPQDEARFLANYIFNVRGDKELAMLCVNAEARVSYCELLKKEYESIGGQVPILEFYARNETDFRVLLQKVKFSGARTIFAGAYPLELAEMLKQKESLAFDAQFIGIYNIEVNDFLDAASGLAEGIIYSHYFTLENIPDESSFVDKYRSKTGEDPNYHAALTYDSVRVIAQAMKNCTNPNESVCIKDELYKIKDFQGVTGKINFDANGDTRKEIILKTVKNGKFVSFE